MFEVDWNPPSLIKTNINSLERLRNFMSHRNQYLSETNLKWQIFITADS